MRRLPDHAMIAQRYANCADENIRRADTAINEKERAYHALIAAEYLLLAFGLSLTLSCRGTPPP
jgi:hypothetical protein